MLVGGWPTRLKNMSSSDGVTIPNIWKNRKCSKPPTSYRIYSCYKLKLVFFAVPGWILEGAQSSGIELQVQNRMLVGGF